MSFSIYLQRVPALVKTSPGQRLPCQDAQPYLNRVHPSGIGRRVAEKDVWMLRKPNSMPFVDGMAIKDCAVFFYAGQFPSQPAHKGKEAFLCFMA